MMKTISAILISLLLAAAAMGQDEGAFLPGEKEYNAAVEKANAALSGGSYQADLKEFEELEKFKETVKALVVLGNNFSDRPGKFDGA